MLNHKDPTPQEIKDTQLYLEMGLSDEEYELVLEILGRAPNYTETGLFSVMWSEHCSYKNSKPVLKKFPTTGKHVLQGPGEGAGVVDIGDGQAVVFKVESHNSPSAIEPYQGAATGVGGIVRDVFSMGARPIALLNSLRFGELTSDRAKHLFQEAVAGIGDYGNTLGITTVGGEIYFDDCYEGNPLVNAMCVGLIDHVDLQKGVAEGIGNSVVYLGAATGRDGIHGAIMSSAELDEDSAGKVANIQAGDPFLEKILMEACLELVKNPYLKGIQDMGAAGLTSSSSEMASKAGNGIELNLDLVPQRELNMTAYEMMLSESQERMLLVVEKGHEHEISEICDRYGLEAVTIGKVTDDKRMRLIHHGEVVADVPVDNLADDAPVYHKPSQQPQSYLENQSFSVNEIEIDDFKATLKELLAMPSIADKSWAYQQYDYTVGTNTLVMPGSDAGVIRIKGTDKALAISVDCNSGYLHLDPYHGGAMAVAESARNVVCSGAKPLALTDCLNFGSPENPEVFWQFEQAAEGMSAAASRLNTPVVSGNVSLYNESKDKAIYPTPVIGMVGLVENLAHVTTQFYKDDGDIIVLLGKTLPELAGSHLQKLHEKALKGKLPVIDLGYEYQVQDMVLTAIRQGLLNSAHDVSEGGLAVNIAESLFGTRHGVELEFDSNLSLTATLFGESPSRIVVSLDPTKLEQLDQLATVAQVDLKVIGKVSDTPNFKIMLNQDEIINCPVAELERSWKDAIPCLMIV